MPRSGYFILCRRASQLLGLRVGLEDHSDAKPTSEAARGGLRVCRAAASQNL